MKRITKKCMALFLTVVMLLTSLGMATVFAAEGEKADEDAKATQVAAPKASVKAGTYKDAQNVKLTSDTKDAVIYYTTDGKKPTEKSKKYNEKKPIEVKETTTIQAFAVKEGLKDSKIVELVYTIGEAAPTEYPVATLPAESKLIMSVADAKAAAEPKGVDEEQPKAVEDEASPEDPTLTPTPDPTGTPTPTPDPSETPTGTPTPTPDPSETPTGTPTPSPDQTETPGPEKATAITKVEVTGLDRPTRGGKPDTKASATKASHAEVASVSWTKGAVDGDAVGKGTFKAGATYYAHILLEAKAGYEFDLAAFPNGKNTSNAKVSNYGSNPNVVSVSSEKLELCVGWTIPEGVAVNASDNKIDGLKSSYATGSDVTFTMIGAGASNPAVDGNQRYVPISFKIDNKEYSAQNSNVAATDYAASVSKTVRVTSAGDYKLAVTYQKQVYNGDTGKWENIDGATDTKSATIKVTKTTSTQNASSTRNKAKSSDSKSATNASTGDETPIAMWLGIIVLAVIAVAAVVVVKRRKSQNK